MIRSFIFFFFCLGFSLFADRAKGQECSENGGTIGEDFELKSHIEGTSPTLLLDLEKSINMAMNARRKLGHALGGVQQAEITLSLAESDFDWRIFPKGDAGIVGGGKAGFGATIASGVDVRKKFESGTLIGFNPTLMKAAKHYQSNLRAYIEQPLIRGFGRDFVLAPLYGAHYTWRSATRNLYLAKIKLIVQTIQCLYEVIRQETLYKLETESLERISKFCNSTKVKEKIGLCDSLDVYRAEIELKHTEDRVHQSRDRLQDAQDMLKEILVIPLETDIKVSISLEYVSIDMSFDEALNIALANRIELSQAEDQFQESQRLSSLANKNLLPELNLVIDYTSFSRDEAFTRSWTNKRESKWGIGFKTSTDISCRYENAAYEQSLIALNNAEINLEQMRENIILDVKRSLRTLARDEERIKLQKEQINTAHSEFHLARLKFEHGMANNFDLIQAEKNLRLAQTTLMSATIDHKIDEFRFLATLGTLADKPEL